PKGLVSLFFKRLAASWTALHHGHWPLLPIKTSSPAGITFPRSWPMARLDLRASTNTWSSTRGAKASIRKDWPFFRKETGGCWLNLAERRPANPRTVRGKWLRLYNAPQILRWCAFIPIVSKPRKSGRFASPALARSPTCLANLLAGKGGKIQRYRPKNL